MLTTEDEFQALLDKNPDDFLTRLVFADWLDERGDPRGPGYRALGEQRRRAVLGTGGLRWYFGSDQNPISADPHYEKCLLPKKWFRPFPRLSRIGTGKYWSIGYISRREAENDAAHAFTAKG